MPNYLRTISLLAATVAFTFMLTACSSDDGGGGAFSVARADAAHNEDPPVSTGELSPLVDGNTAFALDLYGLLREGDGNLFFSPHSISVALAMTYAGAAGETATEIADTLHFDLPAEELHPAFNRLSLELEARSETETEDDAEPFELSIANSIWVEETFEFLPAFLRTLAVDYDAGARLVDYINDPSGAREAINAWVADETNDRIPELIPQGIINAMTRLVLTNAIFFKASWAEPFSEEATQAGDFHLLSGQTVTTPLMRSQGTRNLPYAEGEGFQAIELPYAGDEVAMVLILPEEGAFQDFESSLDADRLNEIVGGLQSQAVSVLMPKFEFSSDVPLKSALTALGMPSAFDPDAADFSGMDGTRELYIQDVLHKAFVAVDEEGTEAAAATAVVIGVTSAPVDPKSFEADRPFIFLIRDRITGSVLFIGRVLDPTATE